MSNEDLLNKVLDKTTQMLEDMNNLSKEDFESRMDTYARDGLPFILLFLRERPLNGFADINMLKARIEEML